MVLDTSIQEEESITSTETEDFDNSSDIFGVKEYAEDIYEYLREAEVRNINISSHHYPTKGWL